MKWLDDFYGHEGYIPEMKAQACLCGRVGSIRSVKYAGAKEMLALSLAVDTVSKAKDGTKTIKTDWFAVKVFEGCEVQHDVYGPPKEGDQAHERKRSKPSDIKKGDLVEVFGKLSIERFTRQDGTEGISVALIASSVTIYVKERFWTRDEALKNEPFYWPKKH